MAWTARAPYPCSALQTPFMICFQTTFPPPTTFLILRSGRLSTAWAGSELIHFEAFVYFPHYRLGSNYVVLLDTGHPYSSLSLSKSIMFFIRQLKYVLFPKKINTYLFSATLPYTYGPVFSILTHFFIQHTFVDLACTNNPSKKLGWLDRTDPLHWRRPCLPLPCHLSLYSIVTTKFVAAMSWKILYL